LNPSLSSIILILDEERNTTEEQSDDGSDALMEIFLQSFESGSEASKKVTKETRKKSLIKYISYTSNLNHLKVT